MCKLFAFQKVIKIYFINYLYRDPRTRNKDGCLYRSQKSGYEFAISDCNHLMNPLCFKEKGFVTEKNVSLTCGPNTFMDIFGVCRCNSGFFEAEVDDAKLIAKGCQNPCQAKPCFNRKNTLCFARNAIDFVCLCKDNFTLDQFRNCGRNCEEHNWVHGEIRNLEECVDGRIQELCKVGRNHGRKVLMADSIERICDNGTLKLEKCMSIVSFIHCYKLRN